MFTQNKNIFFQIFLLGSFLVCTLITPVTAFSEISKSKVWPLEAEENMPENEKEPTTKKVHILCAELNDSPDSKKIAGLYTLRNFNTIRKNCGLQKFNNIFTPPESII